MSSYDEEPRKSLKKNIRLKDKSSKAVTEKVIDRRIALILYRYRTTGFIKEIHGCVSTGKEANVYHAIDSNNCSVAIKIFKTSVLDYKDRRRYLEGDIRLKYWNVGKNTRRMIKKWTEKEMRNLIRLYKAGIKAPKPLKVRDSILVMTFLGRDQRAFPTLREISTSKSSFIKIFHQGMMILKQMYYTCSLVHADFSEYNLLVDCFDNDNPVLYVIDVSQSIEKHSPRAYEFLKHDLNNFLKFISKQNVLVPSIKDCFRLIVDDSLDLEGFKEKLDLLMVHLQTNHNDCYEEDYIFQNTHTEFNLHQITPFQEEQLNYYINNSDLEHSNLDLLTETFLKKISLQESYSEPEYSESSEICSDVDKILEISSSSFSNPEETVDYKLQRKEHKREVKEQNREKRKHKMKKSKKKALIKNSQNKK